MKARSFIAVLAGLLFAGAAAVAGERREPVTDPAKAGEDFAIQGEYEGTIPTTKGPKRVGVQVVALGDGAFEAHGFEGGLPGEEGVRRTPKTASGRREDGTVVLLTEGTGGRGIIRDGVLAAYDDDGEVVGKIERVDRKSETLGAKPPPGATVLFDGKNVDAWEGARLTEDGYLTPFRTGKHTESKRKLQSCKLHLEFQTPWMPYARGQNRGNSGVYLQGSYEVQVLDSFGQKPAHDLCGGIYSVAPPKANVCFPPLSWQTYDIDFTAARFDDAGKVLEHARMTVRHNGVLVHEDQEIDHRTTASIHGIGPEPRGIYLQDHGTPVRYRNIWVVETE